MTVGEHDGRERDSHVRRSDLETDQYRLFKIFSSVLLLRGFLPWEGSGSKDLGE